MGVPPSLHTTAKSLEEDSDLWRRLLDGTMSLSADFPEDIQRRIITACGKRQISDEAKADLHKAMHTAFNFVENHNPHPTSAEVYATLKWSPSPRRRQDATTRPFYFVSSGSGYRAGGPHHRQRSFILLYLTYY
jgi:hypothetical protein